MKKSLFFPVMALLLFFALPAEESAGFPPGVPVIVMTHPTVFQIKNIVEMYEKDIIPLKKLVLLGIYHEDEFANAEEAKNYSDAFDYVRENRLTWVRFRKITGRVETGELFRENLWTPQFKEIFALAQGIIFTGGMDIPPQLYGQKTSLLSEPTTPARSRYEVSFLFHLLGGRQNPSFLPFLNGQRDFPVLAICLGLQSLNVATGGSLIQDIPSDVYGQRTVEDVLAAAPDGVHSGVYLEKLYPNDDDLAYPFHRVRLSRDSIFIGKMGFSLNDRPFVVTAHHQAIGKLGANLRISATSLDGKIVEAIEHELFVNVLGIQFHPERHTLYRKGFFQRLRTPDPMEFNPLSFLKSNSPSYAFHHAIWKWFSETVLAQTRLGTR